MTDYRQPYSILFHAVTDALSELKKQNYGVAKETLILAQQTAESLFFQDSPETSADPFPSEPDKNS